MKIYIKETHLELLKRYCNLEIGSNILFENKNKVTIIGDKQYFENLLDKISDVLIDKGMDESDEPNEPGLQIEEVIDILSNVVYD